MTNLVKRNPLTALFITFLIPFVIAFEVLMYVF